MAWIPINLRRQVYERSGGQCEYCQAQESSVIDMEIDHIIPLSRDGTTTLDNLCLSCVGCNGHKREFVTAVDPKTGNEAELFNPRTQLWKHHFRWDDDYKSVFGIPAVGRATVYRLQLNRPGALRARRRWVDAALHAPD